MAVNLIRRNNQEEVTAYQDAVMIHLAKGANGVVRDVGRQFELTYDSQTLSATIHSGMGVLYGRQFEIKEGEEVVWDWSTISGERYITVYVEVDLRDPTTESAKLKSIYASSDYPSIDAGDNLISTPTGIARMPMFWVKRSANGAVTSESKYTLLQNDKIVNADKVGGVAVTTPNGVMTAKLDYASTVEVIERKRLIYEGEAMLYQTNSVGAVITVSETVFDEDVLEFVYDSGWYPSTPETEIPSNGTRLVSRVRVGNVSIVDANDRYIPGVVVTALIGSGTSKTFSAVGDTFLVSGNILTYKGGFVRLNLSSSTTTSSSMRITKIYKIIGGA